MNDTSNKTGSCPRTEEKGGESRRARSIRFSDSEWQAIETAAEARGMNSAEFARHAALWLASSQYDTEMGGLLPQHADLLERIFRSTHILVTLKRNDLIRDGRGEELDKLVRSTRELQSALIDEAKEKPPDHRHQR